MEMTKVALMSGVLCVLAPLMIPVPGSPVPLSMATFGVYLAGAILGAKQGAGCILIYLLLGMVGLPVFSGFSGGVGVLLGPTGGYITGYLPCALVVGKLTAHRLSKVWNGLAMAVGTVICYFFGTVWFLIIMDGTYSFKQVMLICVVPYLIFDSFKILVAALLAAPIRKVLRRIEFTGSNV